MTNILNVINTNPHYAKEAAENSYRDKVYVVWCPASERIERFCKTKRSAESYISKQTSISYYDEYSMDMTTCGKGLEVEVVSVFDLVDYINDKKMWYFEVKNHMSYPHMAKGIIQTAKYFQVSEDIISFIEELVNDLISNGGLKYITEYEEVNIDAAETVKNELHEEEVAVNEQVEENENTDTVALEVEIKFNEDLNGIELYFAGKPSEEIREQLKANGFRWSKRGFWYAKQNTKTLAYIKGFTASEEATEPEAEPEQMQHKEQETKEEISNTSNVIYHDFEQSEEKEEEQPAMTTDTFGDIFSKFENIDITAEQQTSSEDIEFCKEQEEIYTKLVKAHSSLIPQLQEIYELAEDHSKKYTKQSSRYTTAYAYSLKPSDIEKTINDMKNKFISAVCYYFMNKYSVTINYESIQSKYKNDVTHEQIINEIINQLGGYNFQEKAEQEIKDNLRESFTWKKAENKGKKMILNNFLYIDTSWKKWGEEKIHYNSNGKLNTLFKALQHFENGYIDMNEQLQTLYKQLVSGKNDAVFIKHDLNFSKFQSIKIFKNGKVEIEFATSQHADNFNKNYCFSNVA